MRNLFLMAAATLTWSAATQADNPINNPYQQYATKICEEVGQCQIVFPAVARETVTLHASCFFGLEQGGVGSSILGIQGAEGYNELPFFQTARSDCITNYGINAETYLFISAGQQPMIEVFSVSSVVLDLTCTISGYQRP